jgi:hypothetical protein
MPKPINNNEWSYESNDRIDIGNIECHNINNESIQNFETINQARLAKGCYFYSRGTNGNNPREDQKILIKKKKKNYNKGSKNNNNKRRYNCEKRDNNNTINNIECLEDKEFTWLDISFSNNF